MTSYDKRFALRRPSSQLPNLLILGHKSVAQLSLLQLFWFYEAVTVDFG